MKVPAVLSGQTVAKIRAMTVASESGAGLTSVGLALTKFLCNAGEDLTDILSVSAVISLCEVNHQTGSHPSLHL